MLVRLREGVISRGDAHQYGTPSILFAAIAFQDWVTTVLDRENTNHIARTHNAEKFVGHPASLVLNQVSKQGWSNFESSKITTDDLPAARKE